MQLLELKSMHAITTAHKHVFQAAKQRSGRVLHKVVSPMFVDALSEVHGKLRQDYCVLPESFIVTHLDDAIAPAPASCTSSDSSKPAGAKSADISSEDDDLYTPRAAPTTQANPATKTPTKSTPKKQPRPSPVIKEEPSPTKPRKSVTHPMCLLTCHNDVV
jgi:hypothetical protein